ncbi:pentapeptide repeat-containing protein [Proteus alimentorum]|uniref:E3 ubiquitin-protein ligase SopA n=1 Tax=Proteus alimentorum TaxID=1973495 RepID=A0ABS0IU09_9GAMM|nr:pentapeptide repeat-containing protein [Proteus alimentorum]MBG2875632.1 pentapeptide repeat-containing protein [Proteus alimentorum]MBG2879514.1 pentapeptide repeat-containing protein [Proteus alimentorum]
MSNIYLYLKAHVMRSSVAAVDLANRNPSLSNIHFAEKILKIKSTNTQLKLEKCSDNKFFRQEELIKYKLLSDKINEIRNDCTDKNELTNGNIKNSEVIKLIGSSDPFKRPYDFSNENLISIDLKNKDLRRANFNSSYSIDKQWVNKGVDFSGSNLKGVDLTKANLEGSIFINSDLTGAKVHLNNVNYSNAKLDDAEINFNPNFSFSNSKLIGEYLDENLSEYTLFDTINSIDDKYYKIKTSLMRQITDKINGNIELISNSFLVDSITDNILSKEYYLDDEEIYDFTKCLLKNKFESHHNNTRFFQNELFKNHLPLCLDVVSELHNNRRLNDFMMYDYDEFMITNNNEFIELMALSLYHDNKNIQEKARILYEKYLNLDDVKPFVEKEDFGNGNHEVDWSEKDYNNYILLNKNNYTHRNESKAIIISHENLTNMLFSHGTEHDIRWNNFFLYINNENQAMEKIDYYNLFNNDFDIFKNNYNENIHRVMCRKILPILNLDNFYNQFYSAFIGNAITSKQKLVSIENQQKLADIFKKFLIFSNDNIKHTSLKEEHYQEICQSLEIESLDNEEKSKYLLSLATLFVKYSSSAVFGTEYESPQILRMYAYALLSKANELNADLMDDYFNDWENRLLGQDNAFTCTDILFLIMSSYVKKKFNNIYNVIMPPHWR